MVPRDWRRDALAAAVRGTAGSQAGGGGVRACHSQWPASWREGAAATPVRGFGFQRGM
eukprot:COSAG03_NODE_1790_length_3519_cov_4.091813_4_plen_58_part_00